MLRPFVPFLVALAVSLSAGCGAAPVADAATTPSASAAPTVSEAQAREVARTLGEAAGYDSAVYPITGVEWDAARGAWWVYAEHVAPTPPGGHFAVEVDGTSGRGRLLHGE